MKRERPRIDDHIIYSPILYINLHPDTTGYDISGMHFQIISYDRDSFQDMTFFHLVASLQQGITRAKAGSKILLNATL